MSAVDDVVCISTVTDFSIYVELDHYVTNSSVGLSESLKPQLPSAETL